MNKVVIATDGGCRGNQNDGLNVGGYGVVLEYMGNRKELYGGEKNTTNNKMELIACIEGLKFIGDIKTVPIEIMTDSAYLCNCMTQKWYLGWQRNGWRTSGSKDPVKNQDLWEQLLQLIQDKQITWTKVRGHSDHELNNLADALANEAMDEINKKELQKLLTKIN